MATINVASKHLPVVEVKQVLQGTEEYEKKREAIIEEMAGKIPKEYHLSHDIISNPPLNVTDIPQTCGILSKEELAITEQYDAVALAEAVARGEISAGQVATAFCKRAAVAHQLTCCLTDFFMDEALERARYLDDYLRDNGKTVGPLHGVPISVKEHVSVRGHYTSYGFITTRVFDEEDKLIIRILRDAGAIFYVKTNQPQGIMHIESQGFYGRTLNPHNINLTSGGSSGGEAALLAMRGSIMGIGTDIGGSIRAPAGMCGIYGFKPTADLLPIRGCLPGYVPAELNITPSIGPMCHSLRDCDLFLRVIKATKPHLQEPRLSPVPWTGLAISLDLPLKVGIMKHDGAIVPQPPVLRALEWAEKHLSSAKDVIVKPYVAYDVTTAIRNLREALWPDAGMHFVDLLAESGEAMHPLTVSVIGECMGDKQKNAMEITAMLWKRDEFRAEFLRDWNRQDVDVVLCPLHVGPAAAHDTAHYWGYTGLFNYIDFPAIVLPTPIRAEKEKERYSEEYSTPLSKEDAHVRQLWQETDFQGAPINLQLVSRRNTDNELFAALNVLKDALQLA